MNLSRMRFIARTYSGKGVQEVFRRYSSREGEEVEYSREIFDTLCRSTWEGKEADKLNTSSIFEVDKALYIDIFRCTYIVLKI